MQVHFTLQSLYQHVMKQDFDLLWKCLSFAILAELSVPLFNLLEVVSCCADGFCC